MHAAEALAARKEGKKEGKNSYGTSSPYASSGASCRIHTLISLAMDRGR